MTDAIIAQLTTECGTLRAEIVQLRAKCLAAEKERDRAITAKNKAEERQRIVERGCEKLADSLAKASPEKYAVVQAIEAARVRLADPNTRSDLDTARFLLARSRVALCAAPPVYATNAAVMQLVLDIQRFD